MLELVVVVQILTSHWLCEVLRSRHLKRCVTLVIVAATSCEIWFTPPSIAPLTTSACSSVCHNFKSKRNVNWNHFPPMCAAVTWVFDLLQGQGRFKQTQKFRVYSSLLRGPGLIQGGPGVQRVKSRQTSFAHAISSSEWLLSCTLQRSQTHLWIEI